MRSSPTFSDTRFNFSFFLTTPAKKPRTECCCQPVAFMIAAMVVPFGSCNIFSTDDCLEGDEAGAFDDTALDIAVFDVTAAFDRAGTLVFAGRFALPGVFSDLDFDLLVAIWPSLRSTTA